MDGTDDVLVGNEHVVQEDLTETGLTAELLNRSHGDARGLEIEHQVGEALVALRGGIGAEKPESALSERGPTAPDLLSIE